MSIISFRRRQGMFRSRAYPSFHTPSANTKNSRASYRQNNQADANDLLLRRYTRPIYVAKDRKQYDRCPATELKPRKEFVPLREIVCLSFIRRYALIYIQIVQIAGRRVTPASLDQKIKTASTYIIQRRLANKSEGSIAFKAVRFERNLYASRINSYSSGGPKRPWAPRISN